MKIVAFSQNALVQTKVIDDDQAPVTHWQAKARTRYILNDDDTQQIQSDPAAPIWSISDFGPIYQEAVKRPPNFRGKRVGFYRGRAGFGDQLISSALSRFFSEMLKAKCFQLSNRMHEMLWAGNPYIHYKAIQYPLTFDAIFGTKSEPPLFDWFFPLESLCEFDSEPEQGNAYDRQFSLCGLDQDRIPAKYKRPVFTITEQDLDELGDLLGSSYIAFQLRATNIGRTMPSHVLDLVLRVLSETGLPIICLDDCKLSPEVESCISACKNAVNFAVLTKNNVRKYGTIIANAKLVVGPDSSAIHFAAAHEVPCLSIWGSFDPMSRVRYYKNHQALWAPQGCPNSPCYSFMKELPYHKCPDGKEQKFCACFLGITPDEIRDAITKLGL